MTNEWICFLPFVLFLKLAIKKYFWLFYTLIFNSIMAQLHVIELFTKTIFVQSFKQYRQT